MATPRITKDFALPRLVRRFLPDFTTCSFFCVLLEVHLDIFLLLLQVFHPLSPVLGFLMLQLRMLRHGMLPRSC